MLNLTHQPPPPVVGAGSPALLAGASGSGTLLLGTHPDGSHGTAFLNEDPVAPGGAVGLIRPRRTRSLPSDPHHNSPDPRISFHTVIFAASFLTPDF